MDSVKTYSNLFLGIGFSIAISCVVLSLDNAFFWDTVQLGSKHADFYLESRFSSLLLPNALDSGHIPAFGIYLALVWELFGRSLVVSHLAMLPFVLGIVLQLNRLVRRFIPIKYAGLAVLLVLLDPSLLAQMTLVSPDVPLVFFFLLGANAVFDNNRKWLAIAVLLLFLVSLRGMMVSLGLLALDLYLNVDYKQKRGGIIRSWFRKSPAYLPGLVIFLAYSVYHYAEKGWIGFHEDSPWAGSFESVGFKGMLRNVGILGWRLLDFGRVGVWLVFAFLFLKLGRKHLQKKPEKQLLFFFIALLILVPANMIWAKALVGHRYLIPIYLVFSLLCAVMLFRSELKKGLRNVLIAFWMLALITGHLWIYPQHIAQGWDATLAHRPYFELREEANQFLKTENIDTKQVGTFFPNTSPFDLIDLSGDPGDFENFSGKEEYAFYSNVYNLSDEHLALLRTRYSEVKRFEKNGIYVAIYRRSTDL